MKTVLITGIGGNVSQGILRNIQKLGYSIRIIGTNTEKISGGNHLCDRVYVLPMAYEKGYIKAISKICRQEKVNLIIPGTDYESYYLSAAKCRLSTIATSSARVNKIFLDKFLTWKIFSHFSIAFAQTTLPSSFKGQFSEYIVKPREGRGSREIYVNPKDISRFNDKYILQEFYRGTEITTAFYITKRGEFLGQITFIRELNFGQTSKCFVTHKYDRKILDIIGKISKYIDIRGSCNIQSVVTDAGEIIPFEVNARISGTNSIRSHFGFEDVKYTLEEYLYNIKPKKPIITKGSAVRYMADVIYPGIGFEKIENKKTGHFVF